jgi:sulfonate transport system substrate-binding protein
MSSPTRRPLRRLLLLATVLATAGASLAACASGDSNSATTTLGATNANQSGTVLTFGDQQQILQTLLKSSGALNGANYKVNFAEFNSGPLVNAGFAANRIDIGFMGDLPASLAVKSGLPVKTVAVASPIGASEYLLAKPGITSIAQLKGKKVAYTTGTAEQAFALRALATAGLTQKDVTQVNVSLLQLGTVLETGAADASIVSVQQKVDYQKSKPDSKVLATIKTVQPASYLYVLATTAALNNPAKLAAIDDFTKRLVRASNWQQGHLGEWVSDYYVDVQHQTTAAAKQIEANGGTWKYVPITANVQSALQNVVNLLAQAGAAPSAYSVAPLFDAAQSQRYNNTLTEVEKND